MLLRTVWIALLSPSVAPLKIRSDKNQVANFTQKTKRHPQENGGLGPGNPPPNKTTVAKKMRVFWWNLLGNLLKKID